MSCLLGGPSYSLCSLHAAVDSVKHQVDAMFELCRVILDYTSWSEMLPVASVAGLMVTMGLLRYMTSGPMVHPLYALFGQRKPDTHIEGFVAPGYESVGKMFEKFVKSGWEDKAQVCAYVDGRLVIDMYGVYDRHKNDSSSKQYTYGSIQNCFSTTKAVTSIVVAMLVDRGLIDYDTTIASVWPEFAEHEKDHVTIEDLMRHESGLQKFAFSLTADNLQREALKCKAGGNKVGPSISTAQKHKDHRHGHHLPALRRKTCEVGACSKGQICSLSGSSSGGGDSRSSLKEKATVDAKMNSRKAEKKSAGTGAVTTTTTTITSTSESETETETETERTIKVKAKHPVRAYHALTRGWIVNEICMRVDPQQRTVGEFLRDEITQPLDIQGELTLGKETSEYSHKIAPLKSLNHFWLFLQLFNVFNWGRIKLIEVILHLFLKQVFISIDVYSFDFCFF